MKIECTLSAASISNAVEQLRKYADSLEKKTEKLVQSLGEFGTESAANYLGHFYTGETLSSLTFTRNGTTATIFVGGNAVWIEFGTGVVRNEGSGHPKKDDLGMSDWGTYGQGKGANPEGWWYPSEDGYTHTFGIKMNMFMYRSAQDMRKELGRIAKEAFKDD